MEPILVHFVGQPIHEFYNSMELNILFPGIAVKNNTIFIFYFWEFIIHDLKKKTMNTSFINEHSTKIGILEFTFFRDIKYFLSQ